MYACSTVYTYVHRVTGCLLIDKLEWRHNTIYNGGRWRYAEHPWWFSLGCCSSVDESIHFTKRHYAETRPSLGQKIKTTNLV